MQETRANLETRAREMDEAMRNELEERTVAAERAFARAEVAATRAQAQKRYREETRAEREAIDAAEGRINEAETIIYGVDADTAGAIEEGRTRDVTNAVEQMEAARDEITRARGRINRVLDGMSQDFQEASVRSGIELERESVGRREEAATRAVEKAGSLI